MAPRPRSVNTCLQVRDSKQNQSLRRQVVQDAPQALRPVGALRVLTANDPVIGEQLSGHRRPERHVVSEVRQPTIT